MNMVIIKMRNTRKGLGKGLGIGYKNLAPMDGHIHSLSAKGQKTKLTYPEFKNKVYKILDEKEGEIDLVKASYNVYEMNAKGTKKSVEKKLRMPDELTKAKVIFRYDRNDVPIKDVLKILGKDMDLKEHRDFDVAYNQNNHSHSIIFLHTDKAVARVLQSNAFRNKPIRRSTYAELVRDDVEIMGVWGCIKLKSQIGLVQT